MLFSFFYFFFIFYLIFFVVVAVAVTCSLELNSKISFLNIKLANSIFLSITLALLLFFFFFYYCSLIVALGLKTSPNFKSRKIGGRTGNQIFH